MTILYPKILYPKITGTLKVFFEKDFEKKKQ